MASVFVFLRTRNKAQMTNEEKIEIIKVQAALEYLKEEMKSGVSHLRDEIRGCKEQIKDINLQATDQGHELQRLTFSVEHHNQIVKDAEGKLEDMLKYMEDFEKRIDKKIDSYDILFDAVKRRKTDLVVEGMKILVILGTLILAFLGYITPQSH